MAGEFTAAVRSMLLPVSQELEQQYIDYISERIGELDVPESDRATWIQVELRHWRSTGQPSAEFRALIRSALYSPNREPLSFMFSDEDEPWAEIAQRASMSYFELHSTLSETYLLGHDGARQLIAHMGMIARLATQEGMTASEITRLISTRDSRFSKNWRVIHTLLQRLGWAPAIQAEDFQRTFLDDGEVEPELFGDLDLPGSISLVARVAADLGCPGDFDAWLTDLLLNDRHEPYLLILHFQLIVQAHYDHAPTYPYEFNPRGQNARWLTEQYAGAGIPVAQNAFLNNAKATLRFDSAWVAGRTDHARGATALASILMQMESLGALAKIEIASHLRALLSRYVRLERERDGPLPSALPHFDHEEIERILSGIAEANSATTGIAEQRLVDCLGLLRHSPSNGWAPRGIGDSVFAPNLPRRKLGDCEFMIAQSDDPQIVAYEAHGGQLSAAYVADHMASLEEVLRTRAVELEAIAAVDDWDITVRFIAHSFSGNLPEAEVVQLGEHEVAVTLEYMDFADACDELAQHAGKEDLIDRHFTQALNTPFVHPRVRQRLLELAQP